MYENLEECILDLEKHGHLVRIEEEVDPYLEMAAIQRRLYREGGPAVLFERVKGSKYRAVANLFGTMERSKFLFRKNWHKVEQVIALRDDPMKAAKRPLQQLGNGLSALKALPMRKPGLNGSQLEEISLSDIPFVHSWPDDGGAFVTLPQVYSEDPDKPGLMNANLGMYRVQLNGNDYEPNKEVGLHYQIQRGIGVHQAKAAKRGEPLKVSIFIGGPPAHTLSAVMPLPEGLSEMLFAGLLAGRRFRYGYVDGYAVSHDADFVITGDIYPDETKPEGPFGDHLGYYSLTHPFPVMKVHKVYARKNAIYPFTVVGRPPQEDTTFGALIHELTGDAVTQELPGVKEVHAVDAAGVHPLLFAIGSERYTPYQKVKQPMELLTIANAILGYGQLSLAKYLFITAEEDKPISTHDEAAFLQYILERIDLRRDIHFQTNTTIDTLDYSGTGLNSGSKVVLAAYGEKLRELCTAIPSELNECDKITKARYVMPGVVAIETTAFSDYEQAEQELNELTAAIAKKSSLPSCPLLVLCDDSEFVSASLANFLWVTFTRSNPSHDTYGINSFIEHKHWGCDALIIDARIKGHHAPPLVEDEAVEKRVDRFFQAGGPLAHS
ncbi:3-octaprenyl-4-hydroxybenzoate carboxy-lyase [Shouchella clausii]|uniref:3-octaprenyl-4-hydroxybenzoate carboxy-lyase n=1 Tax=Shouchella clausii TaxID=79880 RepID=A0A268S1Z8_SHOCL|nr:UbiD family decarboxylase [Shouchella clausii]MBU8597416.1 UbiD family decarboxylase [Shouchella clausii]MCY1105078.1 UbiD family decarboxylase [Shouchella clausii]MEB5478991.1 UbiD family decarboxylase [Shouchella clausii]MED4159013.1 UbiD family decarboxylase [Shouchella clausii]MED4176854.1 UbiD family decarboxylase [Shouchella clausii]